MPKQKGRPDKAALQHCFPVADYSAADDSEIFFSASVLVPKLIF